MDHGDAYHPPIVLTVLSGIFLILGAVCFIIVAGDIVWRRGWRNMMGIMVPTYPINAAYMMPLTLYVYFKHGRPTLPGSMELKQEASGGTERDKSSSSNEHSCAHAAKTRDQAEPKGKHCHSHATNTTRQVDPESEEASPKDAEAPPHCHHRTTTTSRPMLATVLIGVHHCGAGCVLGDLVGEWLVFGTSASINGASIWVELLVDYAFALLFGIAFQYLSIAPMSGEWGWKSVWRAAKADVLSLTSFEIGAFAWMVVYQVGIFGYRLSMVTWTYWWMMQIGMVLGFATAVPVNWYLLTHGIKEPCC